MKHYTKFRFGWIPLIATIAVAATGVSLGNWQARRADEKRAIEARMQARRSAPLLTVSGEVVKTDDVEFRQVRVHGEFEPGWPLYLDNRPLSGKPGYYLLMPFKIAGSNKRVLVERGWFPVNPNAPRTQMPAIATPTGLIDVEGIAVRNPGRVLQLGQAPAVRPGTILQNLTVNEFAVASGYDMQAFVIEQGGTPGKDAQDGLRRDWPLPSAGIEKHLGYMVQWYALAATAVLFFLISGFRRGKQSNQQ